MRKLTSNAPRLAVQTRILIFGVVASFAFAVSSSHAQSTPQDEIAFSLPEQGVKPVGFVATIVCGNTNSLGEIPVTIEVTPTGKVFPADRMITVRVSPFAKTTQPPGLDCIYEIPIPLAEGASSASKTAYLPKWSIGGEFDLAVLEDRRFLDGYRARIEGVTFSPNQAEAFWFENAKRSFCWIVEDVADTRDARVLFTSLMPEMIFDDDLTTLTKGFHLGDRSNRFRVMNVDQLPRDWRGFDSTDVWMVEYKTLQSLVTRQPKSFKALKDSVRCGGTLWIFGQLTDTELDQWFSRLAKSAERKKPQVTKSLVYANLPVDYEQMRGGSIPSNQPYRIPGRGYRPYLNPLNTGISDAVLDANIAWLKDQDNAGQIDPVFGADYSIHDFALGTIVICRESGALPGTPQQWRTLAKMNANSEATRIERRAIDPCFGDRRFWDWVIPGVAQPPVYTFIGLLIVFVIVVGPLAYRKLTKLGRGYLMMFVAPLLALATTLIMFAYGLVADGLSTRVRVREVTWIGDASGVAVRCNRATYFAGVRPAEGMRFPANAIVLPYQLSAVSDWYQASQLEHSTIGKIELADDAIRFDSGFLPSRQQKQFVTYRPVDNVGLVRVTQLASSASLQVTSGLDFELRQGVVRTENGDYFSFDKLPADGTVPLLSLTSKESGKKLSELYGIQRPLPPSGISSAKRRGDSMIDLLAVLYNLPRQASDPSRLGIGDSLVEGWIRDTLQIRSDLPAGMFVAVADVTEDCIAVDGAELVESVHYVVGTLP